MPTTISAPTGQVDGEEPKVLGVSPISQANAAAIAVLTTQRLVDSSGRTRPATSRGQRL
jgi:hypothetical protein